MAPRSIGEPAKRRRNTMPAEIRAEQRKREGDVLNWETASGINAKVNTICEEVVVCELADFLEQGCPLSIALDMAGVPEETYREWSKKGSAKKEPYVWALTVLKKAAATYIYTQVLELNTAEGINYKKYLEILKLRNGSEWGGGGLDMTDSDFSAEFL